MAEVKMGEVQKNGASERIRTVDIHLGKVTLYQLSYTRFRKRSGRIRKSIFEATPILILFRGTRCGPGRMSCGEALLSYRA